MTSIDQETSQDIAEAILHKGGRYLEAPASGPKKSAKEGNVIVLATRDRPLLDCTHCFRAIGKHTFHLGEEGAASKMDLIQSTCWPAWWQPYTSVPVQISVCRCRRVSDLCSPVISQKARAVPLKHLQKNLKLSIRKDDEMDQLVSLVSCKQAVQACQEARL
ncbi:hypothetical protein HPB48_023283 [Haemaphysalis longicornis]|uniref:6-phosphogluconate dehydrogenase NADP-binding domain-containing protein n=1 Tax=Haemaphysalis longicornis TaxID=44386 RepID=A0A9J6GW67_HAELO|nr:hypothetical protein HPB48_023283 [Haemaphysalis longicornis]